MNRIICEFKADTSGEGIITGYGSIFGNVDSAGDIVAKGAFLDSIKSIKSGAAEWPLMLLQHGGPTTQDQMPVGIWTSIEEDNTGLRLKGQLALKTKRGADTYQLLKMTPRPALSGLSIGYRTKDFELHRTGVAKRTLTKLELVEVSLVTFPANPRARVTSVKSRAESEVDEAAVLKAFQAAEIAKMREANRTGRRG